MNMKVGRIAIWIISRYVFHFVEVEENDVIKCVFLRIML